MARKSKLQQAIEQEPARNYADLKKQFLRLQKGANDRLYELEEVAKSGDKYFKNVLGYAYSKAMKDISAQGGKSKTRFKGAEKTYNELLAQVNDLKNFLNMPTSTKTGIKSQFQNRADTINKKYGTEFTWQQLADFFETGTAEKIFKSYGSDSSFKIIAGVMKTKKDLLQGVKDTEEKHKKTNHFDNLVNDALSKYGKELKDILD